LRHLTFARPAFLRCASRQYPDRNPGETALYERMSGETSGGHSVGFGAYCFVT